MSEGAAEKTGSLATAIAHAKRLLARDPQLAEAQVREVLKVSPGQGDAQLVLAVAQRLQGKTAEAVRMLRALAQANPRGADIQFELGLALSDSGELREAITALKRATAIDPRHPHVWRVLGDRLMLTGDEAGADVAYARHIQACSGNPQLLEAGAALYGNRLAVAERLLRAYLKEHPTDVAAIRMLAETGSRLGRLEDAEALLARALELAPGFTAARHNYATVLYRQNKVPEALHQLDILLKDEPRDPAYRALKAAALAQVGEYEQSARDYQSLLRDFPQHPKAWMSYGHTLKTLGRTNEAIVAYRKSLELLPSLGESYWSFANLKTFRFADEDMTAMRALLARDNLGEADRLHLHFALGKALEDAGAYAESFEQYAEGNALRLSRVPYDAVETSAHVHRSQALFTAEFFAAHEGGGSSAPDPIFIVGLPRAGSTLVEQILSSHSAVEATMELPNIVSMARQLSGRKRKTDPSAYPEILASLPPERFAELGEQYLAQARVHRKQGAPFFIDKMPNNFQHIGLIHLILPRAKIIDVRRHPLACCFSNFKQHFARGQNFAYGLSDLGRYYADYLALMKHFEAVLPDRIHRVIYEKLVENPEGEIRALLNACGLPFEPACRAFHENLRPVRTASSEQVRQPLYMDGIAQWRHFEPWLVPLTKELGSLVDNYAGDSDFRHPV